MWSHCMMDHVIWLYVDHVIWLYDGSCDLIVFLTLNKNSTGGNTTNVASVFDESLNQIADPRFPSWTAHHSLPLTCTLAKGSVFGVNLHVIATIVLVWFWCHNIHQVHTYNFCNLLHTRRVIESSSGSKSTYMVAGNAVIQDYKVDNVAGTSGRWAHVQEYISYTITALLLDQCNYPPWF